MKRVSRTSTAGARYLDLQREARRTGRPTDELIQLYALEGFLDRLSRSGFSQNLILKGGVLLAALNARRPTGDIDFAAHALRNTEDEIPGLVQKIARMSLDDGVEFDAEQATAETIRYEDEYSGIRVTLGGVLTARGYPLEMVLAEKLSTAIARGTANTRWRDFIDIYVLAQRHRIEGDRLRTSLVKVAQHRAVALSPLTTSLEGYEDIAQPRWVAWLKKQRIEATVPAEFRSVLEYTGKFADPVIKDEVARKSWDPTQQTCRVGDALRVIQDLLRGGCCHRRVA